MRNATDIDQESRARSPSPQRRRLREYARLMRLDRPIGIWLLLWPVLWALWISSGGHPDERLFVIFVLGTFVMRSAGCVMNDFADREFDPHVRRTADRPLAKQSVSPAEALGLFAVRRTCGSNSRSAKSLMTQPAERITKVPVTKITNSRSSG